MIHINIPKGYYLGQVRKLGARRWDTVTGRCKSAEAALSKAALLMKGMGRGRVIFVDTSGWYESSIVFEVRR